LGTSLTRSSTTLRAASFAASSVYSLTHPTTFSKARASRVPAAAPLAMLAVMPPTLCDAPLAAETAVGSKVDRLALTLLIGLLALSASTWITSWRVVGGHQELGYNVVMKGTRKAKAAKNSRPDRGAISKLGRELRKLAEEYAASGGKLLNRRELEREIAERRGLR